MCSPSLQAKVEIHCHILQQKRAITTLFKSFGNQFRQNIPPFKEFHSIRVAIEKDQAKPDISHFLYIIHALCKFVHSVRFYPQSV